MRRSFAVLVVVLCATAAAAGTITSISPTMVKVNSGEHFLTIYGSGLGSTVVFDGPAGHFERETNANFFASVVTWVPEAIVGTPGFYDVFVRGGTGDSNVVTFEVRGFKYFPFVILVPELLRIQPLNREGAFVKYEVFPAGGEDPHPVVGCFPESGAFFKMGQTTVTCSGTSGNERAEASFTVIVRDEIGPEVFVPREPIVVKAQSREGAPVEFDASAYDEIYGAVIPECLPRSGSVFPIGVTTVTCTALDADGNAGRAAFDVEVLGEVKWYPLILRLPEGLAVDAASREGEYVKYEVAVEGTEDPAPEVTCTPASGSLFPIGTSTVSCSAIDRWGMRGNGQFGVEVRDPRAPLIERLSATPDVLKPTGELYPVAVDVAAFDEIDPLPRCSIFAVTSNQDIDLGDDGGEKDYDWRITGELTLELRGETTRGERYYDVWVGCQDFYGNRTNATARVVVPAGEGQTAGPAPAKRRAGPKG